MKEDKKIKYKLMNLRLTTYDLRLKNYLELIRIKQPTGIWLLFLPCLFGIALAIKKLPEFDLIATSKIVFLFFLGSVLTRSAGCAINDFFDQKFDSQVERTKNRPLATKMAAKKISKRAALIFIGLLLFLNLIILLQFNRQTILAGFFALALITAYPLMKRITYYPQIFLGITFNFGILMSSLTIFGGIDSDFAVLYFAAIIWTIIYDTIYAYQDIEDDLKIGVKSTAIKFGKNPRKILIWLNLLMFLLFISLGLANDFSIIFFLLIFLSSLFLLQKIKKCDFQNPQNCLQVFKDNLCIGLLILIAIISG